MNCFRRDSNSVIDGSYPTRQLKEPNAHLSANFAAAAQLHRISDGVMKTGPAVPVGKSSHFWTLAISPRTPPAARVITSSPSAVADLTG